MKGISVFIKQVQERLLSPPACETIGKDRHLLACMLCMQNPGSISGTTLFTEHVRNHQLLLCVVTEKEKKIKQVSFKKQCEAKQCEVNFVMCLLREQAWVWERSWEN